MKNGIERRRDPRIPVDWPLVLITSLGTLNGKALNISEGGSALVYFLSPPEIAGAFSIIFKVSEDHEIYTPCELIWSGKINYDESVYDGLGVRFTDISSSDRKFIASMVEKYYSS